MVTRRFRKPYRIRKKKSIFSNRFFWLGILILVIIGTVFYFLFFSEIFQIKKIIVTGEEKVSKEDLKLLIEKKLENKILFFETKSIFLVNLNEIKKNILNDFSQIAEIEIGRGFPDTLNIIVVERLALATWCRGDHCFLLDNEGVIFEETSPQVDLVKIINRQNLDPFNLGEKVIEKKLLVQILEIESKLKKGFKIQPQEISIIFEERLNIKTLEDWKIFLNPRGDIEWQLTKLEAVLEEEIPSERRKDLEYIELRFGNLAPYKYKSSVEAGF